MTFIDAGANIGLHTLAAGRAMQGAGKIVAFEPYGPTRELLSESVFMNGLSDIVEIHEAAVSTKSGIQSLHLGKVSGHHSLYPLGDNGSADGTSVPVRLVSLAEVISAGTRVDLIKIDVEGRNSMFCIVQDRSSNPTPKLP
ncbi:MAG: FkbM family methyltransferase [Dechloromonas sp.]|nr:MAG: FkbM family methyltransferase [Dechloromonas sp.]